MDEADGVKALVMELVEGEDLAQRLTRRPIPLAEALPIANKSPKPSKRPTSRGSSIAISNRRISSCDIACGFIDTSYNGESFFVGHAYFTGADEPYEKLKSSTRRRPFAAPDQGRIAVKVINHYGDEMLKVFDV